MKTGKYLLAIVVMIVAAVGFIVSAVVHVAALCGIALFAEMPWFLHIGIFVVWLPAMLSYNALVDGIGMNNKESWRIAMRGCPQWMRYAYTGLFAYAIVNFLLFMLQSPGKHPAPALVTRGFSGHWLVFYFAAFAICYSYIRVQQHDQRPHCKNGHPASPSAKFCQECGAEIEYNPIR